MREKSCSGVARYEALRDATCALGTNEPITTTAAASRVTPQMTIRTIFIKKIAEIMSDDQKRMVEIA